MDLEDKAFFPVSTERVKKALKNMKNPTMKEIYISPLKCKKNIIQIEPTSSLFSPCLVKSVSQKITSQPIVSGLVAQG